MTQTHSSSTNTEMLRAQLPKYKSLLSSFASSSSTFRIIQSIPPSSSSLSPPKTLYILDSSFNPPTLAHQRIALSALQNDNPTSPLSSKRLILLLATQNADKAPTPATFEQRLSMMQIFASDLQSTIKSTSQTTPSNTSTNPNSNSDLEDQEIGIDIAITKSPYFVDKAKEIENSGSYPPKTEQVHLIGYDTLIRILDPKYYPPSHTLTPLQPFLSSHRLLVTYRTSGTWGEKAAQEALLKEIGKGKRESEGMKREWVTQSRILLAQGRDPNEEIISSTRAREAAKAGDRTLLARLVTEGVVEWILQEGLYLEEMK